MPATPRRALLPAALLATLAAVAAAPAAHASTIAYDGDTFVLTSAPGERDAILISRSDRYDRAVKLGLTGVTAWPAESCEADEMLGWLHCVAPGAVRVDLGDQDDSLSFSDQQGLHGPVTVLGGAGNDLLKGVEQTTHPVTLDGGPGSDTLEGRRGPETLAGGDGNDKLTGAGAADVLQGGAGDDVLDGDLFDDPAPDVLDGGPGFDKVEGWTMPTGTHHPTIMLTVDAGADDGRPGEGDDVRGVESVTAHVSGRFVFTEAPDVVDVWANLDEGPSTISTRGGNDRIMAGNYDETIDAGAGDDRIEAGFGHDAIVAGPGRDVVSADKTGSNCGLFESCDAPYGNDTIDLRDGEADTADCGVGTDRVLADALDTVGPSCETVERSGAGNGPGTGPVTTPRQPTPPSAGTARPRILASAAKATTVRRSGLVLRLTGARPGRVTLVGRIRGRRIGHAQVVVRRDGTARLRLKITRSGRKLVRKGARVVVTGAGTRVTVRLK